MNENLDRVKKIVATLFNVDDAALTATSSAQEIENWDSMGQLMLVLELEQQFDIQIPPESGEQLTSIARIVTYLESAA